jgi:hypothetical protein
MQKENRRDLHRGRTILPVVHASMLASLCTTRMRRSPGQQVQRMWQQRQNRLQRTLRPRRTSRQIHDQRSSNRPAHRPAQRSQRSMPQPIRPHALRQPIHQPLAHQSRSLRRHIPGRQPGPSGRHNQPCLLRMATQCRYDQIELIRHRLHVNRSYVSVFQQCANRRPGQIHLLAPKTAIAYSQHHRSRIRRKFRNHIPSLRAPHRTRRHCTCSAATPSPWHYLSFCLSSSHGICCCFSLITHITAYFV